MKKSLLALLLPLSCARASEIPRLVPTVDIPYANCGQDSTDLLEYSGPDTAYEIGHLLQSSSRAGSICKWGCVMTAAPSYDFFIHAASTDGYGPQGLCIEFPSGNLANLCLDAEHLRKQGVGALGMLCYSSLNAEDAESDKENCRFVHLTSRFIDATYRVLTTYADMHCRHATEERCRYMHTAALTDVDAMGYAAEIERLLDITLERTSP